MLRTLLLEDAPGEQLTLDVAPTTPLLDVLRAAAQRKSVVRGCANGACGACRVIVNGELHASCKLLWRDLPEKASILTYEDVAEEPRVVRAVSVFEAERATRCRLCVGALGVTAKKLSANADDTTPESIEHALEGATCMCTGKGSLRRALTRAFAR